MTVAVAIALYNGERFIEDQLESLRTQTRMPDRVVMCDDGSKDKTVEIIKAYIQKYELGEKWHLVRNPQNLGYIKNFYSAISQCEEDLIFLCDQDDIWKADKIEKMTQIMMEHEEINLLSSKHGIIDGEGNEIKSIMHKEAAETGGLSPVTVKDVMRAYRWPGMIMCIRKHFFDSIIDSIEDYAIPHDLAFVICAADQNTFYEYDYIGAYHRRHNNNTAKEEHRVSKLLSQKRKIEEIEETLRQLNCIIDARLSVKSQTYDIIKYKLEYLVKRKDCLKNGGLKNLIQLYINDKEKLFRIQAFVCDVWIVLFDRNKEAVK